ncbi:DUF3379 family protein [Rheinheimera maricola]|uniref:DUF3379 domain-containing protein n=1 Tax=Rheinheimera maricola TaxID=2793282 RepID=A0ABS7XCW7_9GAMM|nr:DUF3379 family protein [Rheinheimera maricola]MBZ9612915.1 DUF3379 domain-containing protein [Rheinheimera maricola]
MDNTELQQLLLADPFSQHPALQRALSEDANLRQFATELQQQQRELEDALQVPVPPMLAERLLQIPLQHNKTKRNWFTPLALAASIALVSVLGVQLYQGSLAADIGSHALAHVYHEHDFLQTHAQTQTLDEVNLKLADFNASLQDWQDEIIYARYCTFQGVRSLHLAIKTDSGYATVFVVPKDAELAYSAEFADALYQGLTLPRANANIVVVSNNAADLQQLPQKLADKLIFSA